MSLRKEQIGRKGWAQGRVSLKWLKNQTNRLMRRKAKADPENAPTKRPTRFWWD